MLYELIPKYLHDAGLLKKPGLKRIIVEKPFGYDLASAQKLNKIYAAYFKEEDIYRIDHFLGKETVQNIMVTRFGSTIYEPIWNRNYIDHVEITAVENMGIGTRGGYYDGAGALRDMVQNHLMQLLAITAMEPPAKFDKNGFRNEVIKVYQSLRPLTDEYIRDNVVRGNILSADNVITDILLVMTVSVIVKKRMFILIPVRIPTWRCACMWTTGVGREYLFISVPASRCLPR